MNKKENYDYLIVSYILQLYLKLINVNNFKNNLKTIYSNSNNINSDSLNDKIVYLSIFAGLCFIDFTSIFNFLKIEKANELYELFLNELYSLCNNEYLISKIIQPMKIAYEKDIKENTAFDYRISMLWNCLTLESAENNKTPNVEEMIFLLSYMTHWKGITKKYLEEINYINKYKK